MGLLKRRSTGASPSISPAPSAPPPSSTDAVTDLPIWPSGIARLSDGILEVTTGDGIRVARADILEVGVKAPRAGCLSLTIRYRAGLDRPKHSYWVEERHEAALRRLVAQVAPVGSEAS